MVLFYEAHQVIEGGGGGGGSTCLLLPMIQIFPIMIATLPPPPPHTHPLKKREDLPSSPPPPPHLFHLSVVSYASTRVAWGGGGGGGTHTHARHPGNTLNGRSPFSSRWNRSHLWRFTFHFSAFYETSSRLPHASSVQWMKSRVGPKGWLKNSLGKEKLIKRWERRNSEGLVGGGKAWLGRCIGVGCGGGG